MSGAVPLAREVAQLRLQVCTWRAAGESLALVPTMGALHRGHLELVRLAKARCRRAVVSIFVNPTQFAPHEDFERYPRDEAGDLAKLAEVGCDLVWAPDRLEMYPDGFATRIVPGGSAEGLEGEFRPHFFAGVATICCKLFTQVAPDIAVFGEKDYQQLCVVRQMVRDLNLPLDIVELATVREPDGLALSSRNAYLSAEERRTAPLLHRVIADVARGVTQGRGAVVAEGKAALEAAGFKVDYLEVRDAETLLPAVAGSGRRLRVLAAAWLGKTRLIDNVPA
ncbi:MAG: pantoate--beta-alanine ligase [Hyphomicrobiaceae bacterium]|nr:pantoate--beta-alanine ligase [Hyphomicrobiaceae bacterium]